MLPFISFCRPGEWCDIFLKTSLLRVCSGGSSLAHKQTRCCLYKHFDYRKLWEFSIENVIIIITKIQQYLKRISEFFNLFAINIYTNYKLKEWILYFSLLKFKLYLRPQIYIQWLHYIIAHCSYIVPYTLLHSKDKYILLYSIFQSTHLSILSDLCIKFQEKLRMKNN